MTAINSDQAQELLKVLLPQKALSKTELKRALFEATSLAFRLFVAPSETSCSHWVGSRMLHVSPDKLEEARQLPLGKKMAQYGATHPPSTVGFHVVDPEIGRYSQIWIPPKRLCPRTNKTSSGSPPNKHFDKWWKDYPEIWLRVYKQFLHPSTSLINAYQRDLLVFPGESLLIRWCDTTDRVFEEYVKEEYVKTVSLLPPDKGALKEFIKQTEKALRDFHETLLEYSIADLSDKSEVLIIEEIGNELRDNHVIDKLKLSREKYLFAVLESGNDRIWF